MTRWTLCWVLVFGGVAACDSGLPKEYQIDRLRVLGIQAEPPEVGPGDTVALTALVVDPDERPLTLSWSACVLSERGTGPFGGGGETGEGGGGGYGISDAGSCLELNQIDESLVMDLGQGEGATLTIPEDFLSDWTHTARAYGLSKDKPLPEAARQGVTDIAGVNMVVTLVVQTGDETLVAIKRVNVSTASEKNLNPVNSAFHLTGVKDKQDAPVTAAPPGDGSCLTEEHGGLLSLTVGKHFLTALNVPEEPVEYPVLTIGSMVDAVDVLQT